MAEEKFIANMRWDVGELTYSLNGLSLGQLRSKPAEDAQKKQRIVIELKIKRGTKTIEEGLEQTAQYMDTNNATEGHLVIFDPRKKYIMG